MSSSYLNHAHDFHVQNLSITNQMAVASNALDHLHDNVAADALHNSQERSNLPNCHPETRKAVQEEIHRWITGDDDDAETKDILWLAGPAGSGKTAIAGSVAEVCEDEGILARSFFFSSSAGSEPRRVKRCLIMTLAYCLLQHAGLQQLRALILSAIERDPFIFRKSLSAQCKALILKPLHDAKPQLVQSALPKIIVIDGLDEVEANNSRQLGAREARLANEAEQVEILSTLLQAVEAPHFPFRLIIVSRPEPVIREFFSGRAGRLTREAFLDDKYDPRSDIALFLKAKFGEIRRRYKLPTSWPGEEALAELRDNASGQFIYAATVVRFLQTAGMHPQARLEYVLHANLAHASSDTTVFSSLDALYTQILNSSPDPLSSTRWIGAMFFFNDEPALFLRQFLQDYHGQADYLLENLASLISMPAIEDDCLPFVVFHKSLSDFLRDSRRCGRELFEAFRHGYSDFLLKRLGQVLIAKSPAVPLASSEWPAFLRPFLHTFACQGAFVAMGSRTFSTWDDVLAPCDAPWWVGTVDAALRDSKEAGTFMAELFWGVHSVCVMETDCPPYGDCRPLCKHWRNVVISGCKALAWRTPNAVALLRERMQLKAFSQYDHIDRPLLALDTTITIFDPPNGDVDISTRTPPNAPADDYEAMCCLADSLYSRLPEGWLELYVKEIKEGSTASNALRLEIGRITSELGVDIEDAYPFLS